jgi:transposase
MMASRKSSRIELCADERAVLDRRIRRRNIARADAQRAEIILRAADGLNNCAIASAAGVTRQTVRLWRERFAKHRLDGLGDEPRCGAPRRIGDDRIEEIVTKTLEAKPADATHWSTRGMAKASGISAASVHRIWRAFSLQPHRTETFKLSSDPQFVEKVRDIVGLYLDPPEKAVVICVDEKSQIQALDRTQPLLPMRPGQVERRTHDYK